MNLSSYYNNKALFLDFMVYFYSFIDDLNVWRKFYN